jgi:hypothetical protein
MELSSKRKSSKAWILGRPLLIIDHHSLSIRFYSRELIPPRFPVHFPATEPFTVLGITPGHSYVDTIEIIRRKAAEWLSVLPTTEEYGRETAAIRTAENILGDKQAFMRYQSFARKYEESRKNLSKSKIHRQFAKSIIQSTPVLGKRQTIRTTQSGGILSVSLVVSILMLVAVFTIPVGVFSILGATLLSETIFLTWGPFALVPIATLVAVGALGAYWYKRHKDVIVELQASLGQVMDYVEAMVYAIEDRYFIRSYELFQAGSSSFVTKKKHIEKARDAIMADFIKKYVSAFVSRLADMIRKSEAADTISADQFFAFLENNPGEVQQCFQYSLFDLAEVVQDTTLLLESNN